MDSRVLYWVLTLIVLIILILMTNIGVACLITTIIIVLKFLSQTYREKGQLPNVIESGYVKDGFKQAQSVPVPVEKKIPVSLPVAKAPKLPLPDIIISENEKMLNDVLYPKEHSADDKIFNASVISGYKDKKAKEIRSHWNNNNWKKYYDYELGIHERENRDWWTDNDFELSKKHVVI